MTVPDDRCGPGVCPAESAGLACPRDTRKHAAYCRHLAGRPDVWGPEILLTARRDAGLDPPLPAPVATPGMARGGVPDYETHAPLLAPPGRFDAAAHKATKARVDTCAFRGCAAGCQKTRCSLYAREVYWGDCAACCRGRPPGSLPALPPPSPG